MQCASSLILAKNSFYLLLENKKQIDKLRLCTHWFHCMWLEKLLFRNTSWHLSWSLSFVRIKLLFLYSSDVIGASTLSTTMLFLYLVLALDCVLCFLSSHLK